MAAAATGVQHAVEEFDVAGVARWDVGVGAGGGDCGLGAGSVAGHLQRAGTAGMGKGEIGVRGQGAIERGDHTWPLGEQEIAALDIGVACGDGGGGEVIAVSV